MERILIDGLSFAIPLFVMAIGGIYSEKSGVTNLALEGLQGMGAFIGAFVAVLAAGYFGSNSQVPYYLAIGMVPWQVECCIRSYMDCYVSV